MPARAVGPTATIYAWLEQHPDGARWDAMLAWMQAVAIDFEMAHHDVWYRPRSNRRFYVADIPIACTRAIFTVVDVPARAVHIIRFDDDSYTDRTET